MTEEQGKLLGKRLLQYPGSRSVNSDLYDRQVKFRHDLNWTHKRLVKTQQRNNADWTLRLMSDDWLIFSTKRRFYGVFRAVSPDCCNRTWSLLFIPPTRQSLFLPSEVQSRVCRPAAIQTILSKNRSGAPSLSLLLSSSSCCLSSACLPIFSNHAGKKKIKNWTACFQYKHFQMLGCKSRSYNCRGSIFSLTLPSIKVQKDT